MIGKQQPDGKIAQQQTVRLAAATTLANFTTYYLEGDIRFGAQLLTASQQANAKARREYCRASEYAASPCQIPTASPSRKRRQQITHHIGYWQGHLDINCHQGIRCCPAMTVVPRADAGRSAGILPAACDNNTAGSLPALDQRQPHAARPDSLPTAVVEA